MKKSSQVPATLIIAMAAALAASGCQSRREVRRCVDEQGKVLPEQYCTQPGYRGGGAAMAAGAMMMSGRPRWGYGGDVDSQGRVRNFRSSASAGATVVSPSGKTISRGGIGSTGRSFGSFGG